MGSNPGDLYLGRLLDSDTSEPTDRRLELPSHHLTTHGVIVGMTGSGKTGLGVVLLEEVLSNGIPALILDPKGDMGNLLLNFPQLRPVDFEPWIDPGEASRMGVPASQLAADTASRWRQGLAASGMEGADLQRLNESVDFRILTPGSNSGVPLNVIGKLSPPDLDWDSEGEVIRDEIEGLVSGILILAEIEPDPLTSPEHILLSNLMEYHWRQGRSLDFPGLVGQIPQPPLRKLGVFDLDTFFPPGERMKLAMRLNGLMASPSFAEWMQGEPLDIDTLMRAPDGRPRASIVYMSHLSEAERIFTVTLLLSKLVSWMRRQPGTSELRALVYADEVMGLAPPTAEPPSKRPILTLFKQARAHGVGMVLATQNPVDMDYKLMSNAGTWMVGRLQTERDKARIIEAMRSASGEVDIGEWDARIGGLGKREFVMKTARSPVPNLFTTRWAMSYLRGPLTRPDVLSLKEAGVFGSSARESGSPAVPPSPQPTPSPDETPVLPPIASGVAVRYLDPATPWAPDLGVRPGGRRMEAGIAARVRLLFDEQKGDLRHEDEWEAVYFPLRDPFDPGAARTVDHDPRDFRSDAPDGVVFALPPAELDRASYFKTVEREIEDHLAGHLSLHLYRNEPLKLYSRVGESEEAFRTRCMATAEEEADAAAEKLRDRYESRLKTARRRLEEAERRVRELEVDTQQRQQQEILAGAGEVLSMFLGGRRRTRSLAGISSRRSQTRRTRERLRSAEEKLEDYQDEILELEEELKEELQEIWADWKQKAGETDSFEVGLERNDVRLTDLTLFWAPVE